MVPGDYFLKELPLSLSSCFVKHVQTLMAHNISQKVLSLQFSSSASYKKSSESYRTC